MKCEICHENSAETAIGADGDGEELYVCKACAERELVRRKKRREHTRKTQESAAQNQQQGGDGEPPILKAFVNAVSDMVDGIERVVKQHEDGLKAEKARQKEYVPLDGMDVDASYMMRGRLHLEGLHLIGEMDAVQRAVAALDLRLEGLSADGIADVGHLYTFCHSGNTERAKRVVEQIVEQERNARIRLFEEMPRVLDDSVCRALAILKNCRLLSPGEYVDLLSPLRLAAMEGMLDGIKTREIERIMKAQRLASDDQSNVPVEEREAADADRADEVNRRFEDVVMNDEE